MDSNGKTMPLWLLAQKNLKENEKTQKTKKDEDQKRKRKTKCVFKSSPFRIKAHQIIIVNISKRNTEQKSFFVNQTSQLM